MALPKPEPGLVISYTYLWRDQAQSSARVAGAEEGRKARPCAIVVAAADDDGDIRVYVAPITPNPTIRMPSNCRRSSSKNSGSTTRAPGS